MDKFKIDLAYLIPIGIALLGATFGYGVLSDKVDKVEKLVTLSDTNMNKIIALETKMNLLVTPSMKIVPSAKVAENTFRIEILERASK